MPDYVCRGLEQLCKAAGVVANLSPDKVWRVSVAPYRQRRSGEQNNRAWALYRAIADGTGYTAAEVHLICKAKFGEPKVIRMGDMEVTEWSTRDKDVAWMADYLTRCEAWAASELGVCLG